MHQEEIRSQLARYQSFLKQDASNTNLIGEVSDLHLKLGECGQARKILEDGLSTSPNAPALLSRLALVAIASNNIDEAITILQKLTQTGTDNSIIRYNLAYAFMLQGRAAEARDLLLAIVNPDENQAQIELRAVPEARLLLARAHHFLGEMDDAIKQAKLHLAAHPQDPEALGILALLNLDNNDLEAAKEIAEQTLAVDADNLGGLVTLGSLALNRQDEEDAKTYFNHAVAQHPKSGRAWSGMGLATMLSLDVKDALIHFKHAVKHMPDHIGTWHSLGWCQILTNDLSGAKESFNHAMALDRNFAETHGGLAVVAIGQNQLDIAPAMIKRALKLNPMSFAGRFAEGLLSGKGEPKKFEEMIHTILASPAPTTGDETLKDVLIRVASKNKNKLK